MAPRWEGPREATVTGRDRYLFIRILEACNADCFMCGYALSRDRYRFSVDDLRELLPQAHEAGVRFIRFTGGEPLMHRDVVALVAEGARYGMKMSVITNGMLLPRMLDRLADAGLVQVVVSIDGSSAETHDLYRRSPGMFANALEGLRLAVDRGLVTRVNTVVGPHNYREMPDLQRMLTDLGVQQWELSALKLERVIVYPDPDDVRRVCDPLYERRPGVLVPLGKRFYGDTPQEQELFFTRGVTPRASRPLCHVVDDVIYLDAKQGRGYACNCIAHRDAGGPLDGATLRDDQGWRLDSPEFRRHREHFHRNGPLACSGCATSSAGYSDDVARLGTVPAWSY